MAQKICEHDEILSLDGLAKHESVPDGDNQTGYLWDMVLN
jgi:hypothetical protein